MGLTAGQCKGRLDLVLLVELLELGVEHHGDGHEHAVIGRCIQAQYAVL